MATHWLGHVDYIDAVRGDERLESAISNIDYVKLRFEIFTLTPNFNLKTFVQPKTSKNASCEISATTTTTMLNFWIRHEMR